MREFCFKLFADTYFGTGARIEAFSRYHLIYAILIAGAITAVHLLVKNRAAEAKVKCLRVVAYLLCFSYIGDFFVHEFAYPELDGLNMDKLPFHICTVLCPLVALAQFNHNGRKIIEPVTVMAIVGPLMYLCYPASLGNAEPWCYRSVQTMFYHGTLLAWGVLNLTLGLVRLNKCNLWRVGVLLICITLWAKLGSVLMDQNWFFLKEDTFYLGLVEKGVIPQWSLMVINPLCCFGVAAVIYGLYGMAEHVRAHRAAMRAACCCI